MKRPLATRSISVGVLLLFFCFKTTAQCTTANLNWDNLDFLKQDPTYISASQAQTQYFALGSNKLTIGHNYSSANTAGETLNQTGKTGSYAAGADVEFSGNGTITLTFNTAVSNVKFSIQDVEKGQSMSLTALDGATPRSINLTTCAASGTTFLTLVANPSNNPSVTSKDGKNSIGDVDNATNLGSFNVDIAGPVTTITITTSIVSPGFNSTGSNPDFFLSDISACITNPAFHTGYYAISKPFTNQPGYVLSAMNDSVLIINPATGVAKLLFADPTGNNINSMGYDPFNKFLYYTYSLTGGGSPAVVNPNDKSIQKYDVNTGVISTVVSNVNTLGIPTYGSGVESGGAAFYDGAFYIAIEGINGDESKIWRIEFDASFNPVVGARQVFAVPTDNHDWGDFAISNGILYDFDGKSGSNESIYHVNLQTGTTTATYASPGLSFVPRQVAVDWTEKIYNTGTAATSSAGTIVPYNGDGTINTVQQYSVTMPPATPSGSWGDAAEAFLPKVDFGDAPATYDPDPLSPAVNEQDAALQIGSSFDRESLKTSSALADGDGVDEDGIGTVLLFNNISGSYHAQVSVYNNTGASATLIGWLDYNGNGVFDAGEASAVSTVVSNTSLQSVGLNWTGIISPLTNGSYTYLRVRITSTANGMGSANATGWFDNGETEDYRVVVDNTVLPITMISFEAKAINNSSVKLNWIANEDINLQGYEVQRSRNGIDWEKIGYIAGSQSNGAHQYEYTDNDPYKGLSYYRLKLAESINQTKYSQVGKVRLTDPSALVTLYPNPARGKVVVTVMNSILGQLAHIKIMSEKGNQLSYQKVTLVNGSNSIELPVQSSWPSGTYIVVVSTSEGATNKKLVLTK